MSSQVTRRLLDELFEESQAAMLEEKRAAAAVERTCRSARRAEFLLRKSEMASTKTANARSWLAERVATLEQQKMNLQIESLIFAETARLQREHERDVAEKAQEKVKQIRLESANDLRKARSELRHYGLHKDKSSQKLSEEAVQKWSSLFNEALLKANGNEDGNWSTFFHFVDYDSTGFLRFQDFLKATRETLKLHEGQISEVTLKSLWGSIDSSSFGRLSLADWARFIRLKEEHSVASEGEAARTVALTKEASVRQLRALKATGQQFRAEEKQAERLYLTARAASLRETLPVSISASLARTAEARKRMAVTAREERAARLHPKLLSEHSSGSTNAMNIEAQRRIATNLAKITASLCTTWGTLFRFVDSDGDGLIRFDEFEKLLRSTLHLVIDDSQLQSLWHALDQQSSGYISLREFGRFMKLGDDLFEEKRQAHLKEISAYNANMAATLREERRALDQSWRKAQEANAEVSRQRVATLRAQEQRAAEEKANKAAKVRQQKVDAIQDRLAEEAEELRRNIKETKLEALKLHSQVIR